MTPTSVVVAGSGSSASIRADGGVDFAAATSLSLNGVFTSDYDNYIIAVRVEGSSAQNLESRLRVSGTDATASNYVVQFIDARGTSVTAARNTRTAATVGAATNTQRSGSAIYIYGPNLSQPTAFRNISVFGLDNATITDNASTHSLSTSYDGVTIFPGSGNITGMVTVYGYTQ
jgi:hypothetical protein